MTPSESRRGELVIFVGPSRPFTAGVDIPGVTWRGPAVAGDMLRLVAHPPRCVAIIDGLFDQVPAVRHKEILLLMSFGVHVLGAASMGALRAAELSSFGMVGLGQVYRAYAEGRLDRDDEVALLHGPADFDWVPLTVPLVNVRATVLKAARARVLSMPAARRMVALAGEVFYQDRTWDELLSRTWAANHLVTPELSQFVEWLPQGAVDIKRADAAGCIEAALRVMHEPAPSRRAPPDTLFTRALVRSLPPDDPGQKSV